MNEYDLRYLVGTPLDDGPIKIHCPFHDDRTPSFAVYADHAYCFGCGKWESKADFTKRHFTNGPPDIPQRARGSPRTHQTAPPGATLPAVNIWHKTLLEGPRACRLGWFQERGIYTSTIRQHRLGHTGTEFTIPYFRGSQLLGVRFRRDPHYKTDGPKYRSEKGSTRMVYRPNPRGQPTVLCEGEFDTLVLAQYGVDAVTSSGGVGSLHNLDVELPPRLLIAIDQDEAGNKAAIKLLRRYPRARRLHWDGDDRDVSDLVAAVDPAERGKFVREWLSMNS